MEVNDHPIWVVQREDAVVVCATHVYHDPGRVLGMPSQPDFRNRIVRELEGRIEQRLDRTRALQIEEDAPRVVEAFLVVGDLAVQSRCSP